MITGYGKRTYQSGVRIIEIFAEVSFGTRTVRELFARRNCGQQLRREWYFNFTFDQGLARTCITVQ